MEGCVPFGFEEGKTDELDTSNKRTENREGGGYVLTFVHRGNEPTFWYHIGCR